MRSRVLKVLSRVFRIAQEKLSLDSSVDNVPGWDSLAHMNLVVALEDEFKVSFTAEEVISLLSAGIIVETLKEKGRGIDG